MWDREQLIIVKYCSSKPKNKKAKQALKRINAIQPEHIDMVIDLYFAYCRLNFIHDDLVLRCHMDPDAANIQMEARMSDLITD